MTCSDTIKGTVHQYCLSKGKRLSSLSNQYRPQITSDDIRIINNNDGNEQQ